MVLLIPAYKPDEKMTAFLTQAIRETGMPVVVVNDGSPESFDSLYKTASELGADVIGYRENRGKGFALKYGFKHILEKFGSVTVITADADGQHTVSDIMKVKTALEENPDSLIIGSRAFQGKVPFKSRAGNGITRVVFATFCGQYIRDTQSGLRGIPASSLESMTLLKGNRYEYEMNMLIRAADEGVKMLEVDIETIYIDDNKSSHFHAVRDAFLIYRLILASRFPDILALAAEILMFFLAVFINGRENLDQFSLLPVLACSTTFSYVVWMILGFFRSGKVYSHRMTFYLLETINFLIYYFGISLLFLNLGWGLVSAKLLTVLIVVLLRCVTNLLFDLKKH